MNPSSVFITTNTDTLEQTHTTINCEQDLSRVYTEADVQNARSCGGQKVVCVVNCWLPNRDSSVGIALGYGLDVRGSKVRFSAGAGNFSLHHRVQNGSGSHPASCRMSTRDHSPPLVPSSKNEWSHTSAPPIRLHGAALSLKQGGDNFTFTF
jgi:hypothetical protein